MNRAALLSSLPGYQGNRQLLNKRQTVRDIMRELIKAHKEFAPDYDKICLQFNRDNVKDICSALSRFLKANITYSMEPDSSQTVKSPAAILNHKAGDCKHYASFAGGILDGLNRTGKNIDWCYRFASYSFFTPEPEHIFVVVKNNGKEIWIDPTPGAKDQIPVWQIDKKVKAVNKMALYKISGTESNNLNSYPISDLLDSIDYQLNPQLYLSIMLLLKYGILNTDAKVNDKHLANLQTKVTPDIYQQLIDARICLQNNAIGGFFSTIWRGVKKVTLAIPRAAFLSLVAINAFGYARKLYDSLFNKDGTYTSFKEKIKTLWQDRLGGDWTKLENTIKNGHTKKAILGVAPAIPAWVVTATACIAAIMPLVNAFLKTKQETLPVYEDYNIDPLTGLPYGQPGIDTTAANDPLNFIKQNPVLIIGGAAALYLFTRKKRA